MNNCFIETKFQEKLFFPFRVQKISSRQVKKYMGQRQVNSLFTAGQKNVQVGSGRVRAYL